ncbi:MAG: Gfo/Idh/MocA family oxidoreductase [Phycisphaeraceae bacterium]|nr:Gfo/Idh/MocA family oxidoreductase [Phycisphaeraceae bacterium]
MNRRYRIGVIGAGSRATAFTPQLHTRMTRAELYGVCDIDGDRLDRYVKEQHLEGIRASTDVEAFLNEKELDAVVVTAADFAHCDITVKALKAGKPVYMEKPIAHTLDDAYTMLECQRQTGGLVYMGFNLRASPTYIKLRQLIRGGVLGQVLHITGVEQLHVAHIASFMRRFHRHSHLNGGLLNAKCSHDMDLLQWLIGHEHRVVKISSFGGCDIFKPARQPATHCRLCPSATYNACPYKAPNADDLRAGRATLPRENNPDLYPGDLCVYTHDKDLVDNQTLILEWDHGVRGNFNLQAFQHMGNRTNRIWGEKGVLDFDTLREPNITFTHSATGDVENLHFQPRVGGHGGVDGLMLDRFLDAIESHDVGDAGMKEGLAATLLAIKADESRLTGKTVEIPMEMYEQRPQSV